MRRDADGALEGFYEALAVVAPPEPAPSPVRLLAWAALGPAAVAAMLVAVAFLSVPESQPGIGSWLQRDQIQALGLNPAPPDRRRSERSLKWHYA